MVLKNLFSQSFVSDLYGRTTTQSYLSSNLGLITPSKNLISSSPSTQMYNILYAITPSANCGRTVLPHLFRFQGKLAPSPSQRVGKEWRILHCSWRLAIYLLIPHILLSRDFGL